MPHKNFLLLGVLLGAVTGCPQFDQRNSFLTYTEEFGNTQTASDSDENGTGTNTAADIGFRQGMQITLLNGFIPYASAPVGDLSVSFVAWVNVSSIRTAEQQDALFANGYVELSREVRLGSVFTLPPGTFVFNGAGVAGATLVRIESPADPATPTSRTIDLITPDVMLFFSAPPEACDSPGFTFTDGGFQLDAETAGVFVPGVSAGIDSHTGATDALGIHTLAQYDAYQCEPFKPGLFLRIGGGLPEKNEYFEGQSVTVLFNSGPDANGFFANVTIAD